MVQAGAVCNALDQPASAFRECDRTATRNQHSHKKDVVPPPEGSPGGGDLETRGPAAPSLARTSAPSVLEPTRQPKITHLGLVHLAHSKWVARLSRDQAGENFRPARNSTVKLLQQG